MELTLSLDKNQLVFPGANIIKEPVLDLCYEIDIQAAPEKIWPWLKQLGYHRGGWYIDTWWDKFEQKYFWPAVVPPEARGTYQPAADKILPQYQNLQLADIIPDGPPGTAYYEVIEIVPNQHLVLYATTHFKYMAPQFVYKTRYAPHGAFCWAFILKDNDGEHTKLISWWQAEVLPKNIFLFFKPFVYLVDRAHQNQILKGIKQRVETT